MRWISVFCCLKKDELKNFECFVYNTLNVSSSKQLVPFLVFNLYTNTIALFVTTLRCKLAPHCISNYRSTASTLRMLIVGTVASMIMPAIYPRLADTVRLLQCCLTLRRALWCSGVFVEFGIALPSQPFALIWI